MNVRAYSLSLVVVLFACHSADKTEGRRTTELAEKLVACENERNDLKEKLATVQAERTRAAAPLTDGGTGPAEAAEAPGKTAGTTQAQAKSAAAGPAVRRAGRTPPRGTDDVAPARPMVHHVSGRDNPAAEYHAFEVVAQLLKSHSREFRPCYEKGLKRNASLQFVSQVKVRVTATPEGRPKDVHLTPKADPEMESCIAHLIASWPLPRYQGQPVVVEMPVSLKVQGQ